jgi:imidazolonepropionase-like amidohydrolase
VRVLKTLTICSLFLLQASSAFSAMKVLRFGKLVDGSGGVATNAVVVIEADRIKSVNTSEASIPAGAEIIDLSRYTAIPGLIDVHTHLAGGASAPSNRPPQQPPQPPYMAVIGMFRGQTGARTMLASGVTTIRNLGAVQFLDLAMRDMINAGDIVGPRMFVSGPGLRTSSALGVRVPEATADGPAEVMRVVRQLIAAGVDNIKIFGSTGNVLELTGCRAFTYEELKAAVETAHALGKKVAVHTYGPAAARDAARVGADSIEHAVDMDDATIAEMAKRGVVYVPTIDHNRWYRDNVRGATGDDKTHLDDFINRNLETAKRAVKAGVKFAMGSDGGASAMLGETTKELGWFVKAGMTPAQALATATTNAAALLGKEHDLGRVAQGYYADIVAVEGDPLKDIDVVINHVQWVMKAGAVVFDKNKGPHTN